MSTWRRKTAVEIVVVTLVLIAFAYADPRALDSPWYFEWSFALLWVAIQRIAVNAVFRWGRQRPHATRLTIGAAYLTVAVVGAAINAAALVIAKLVLEIPTISHDIYDALRRGAINGLLILGIWSLLYVVPRMVQEALVGNYPDRARELIGDLGDLLRDVVRNAERTRHAAADEIAWLERYAHLLEARHPGQLSVRLQLADDARDIAIPIMLLQPVLENAIHHGALQGDGHVEVDVRLVDGMLQCTIDDDGPGLSPQPIREAARGIELVRQRLALDAPGGSFELASRDRGARAILLLPAGR